MPNISLSFPDGFFSFIDERGTLPIELTQFSISPSRINIPGTTRSVAHNKLLHICLFVIPIYSIFVMMDEGKCSVEVLVDSIHGIGHIQIWVVRKY